MRVSLGKKVLRTIFRPLYKRVKAQEAARETTETLQKTLQSNPIENVGLPLKQYSGKVNSQNVSENGNVFFSVETEYKDGKTVRKTLKGYVSDNKTFQNTVPYKHGEYEADLHRYKGLPFDKYIEENGKDLSKWTPDIVNVELKSVEGQPNLYRLEKAQKQVVDNVEYVGQSPRKLIFDMDKDILVERKNVDVSPDELVKKITDNYDYLDIETKNLRVLTDDGRVLSPKVEKYKRAPIDSEIFRPEQKVNIKYIQDAPLTAPKSSTLDGVKISAREVTESFVPKSDKYYAQAEQEFIAVRNSVLRHGNYTNISSEEVLNNFVSGATQPYFKFENGNLKVKAVEEVLKCEKGIITPDKYEGVVKDILGDKPISSFITEFIKKDLSSMKQCSASTVQLLAQNYATKFVRYSLNSSDLILAAMKPLKDCSMSEFKTLLKVLSPKKYKKCEENNLFNKDLIELVKELTSTPNANPTTKLVDLLPLL